MRSHRQPATTLPERNLGTIPEIFESDLVPTGSKCRFRIGDSRAVPIAAGKNICVLPKGYDNLCTSTHALRWNFGPDMEFCETSVLSTVLECENNPKGVTISAMLVHPYLLPGEDFSYRVEHSFRSP
ncbi:hypothetical protein Taro_018142 [Colocasia esculenta]|uniref:Uncharacterized protein n=1 Tax=Colocasia esculenta TaxID=4460 RepID=A0A843UVB2_COLES|nr:hypothetical protein [Colocasia esculenta]